MDQPTPVSSNLTAPRKRWLPWLVWSGIVLVIAGAVAYAAWSGILIPRPPTDRLEADFSVRLTKVKAQESLAIDDPGALPVRPGDFLHLNVRYNQPALTFLIWIDGRGKALPLYPWNQDTIEVKDINEPPPVCTPVKYIMSPMTIGGGWKVDQHGGLDTILLLARRTPLDEKLRMGNLLGPLPASKLRDRAELAVLSLDPGARELKARKALNRGSEAEAHEADRSLAAVLERARGEFELIRAVRFAHEGE